MVPFAGLLAALYQIPDPRRRQGGRYSLAHLLLFAVLAILAGATSSRRIRLFIGAHRERLNATFGARFRRAPPSTRCAFSCTPSTRPRSRPPSAATPKHLGDAAAPPGRRVIALDGKTLRGSFDHLDDQAAAQVLSAFASEAALILAHQEIAEGDEIAAAQALIEQLGLSGILFTADALHCQRKPSPPRPRPATRCWCGSRTTSHACLRAWPAGAPSRLPPFTSTPSTVILMVARAFAGSRSSPRPTPLDPDWRPLIACVVRVTRRTLCRDTRTGLWGGNGVRLPTTPARSARRTSLCHGHPWPLGNREPQPPCA